MNHIYLGLVILVERSLFLQAFGAANTVGARRRLRREQRLYVDKLNIVIIVVVTVYDIRVLESRGSVL